MRIIRGRHNISKQDQGCVVTIGNFDGVHRGHQAILHEVNRLARKKACKSLLICFEPQPREFFEAYQAPARLTRFREKVVQLAASGLDRLLCLQFNDDIRSLSVASFVDLLVQELEVEALFIGDDFRFGADRSGDYEALKAAGARPQRLLFASTGVKDPSLPGAYYVTALAAPETVNTMPENTLESTAALREVPGAQPADGGTCEAMLDRISAAGVDLDALGERLQIEGRDAFDASWSSLLSDLGRKSAAVGAA